VVDRDLANAIKEMDYKVFTGLNEGKFKVLSDPSGNSKQDKELVKSPANTASGHGNGGTVTNTPSDTAAAEIRGKVKEPRASECTEPTTVDEGIPRDTQSMAENSSEGKRMETPSLNTDDRERKKGFTMIFIQNNLHHRRQLWRL
jgi:hypothetical protein